MEFVKRSLLQARALMEQLGPSQKWLIGFVLIVMLLSGYLLLQYAARPELEPITGFASDRDAEVTRRLEQQGIPVVSQNRQLWVPRKRFQDALATLHQSDLLAVDTSRAFDELLQTQSVWSSNDQNRRMFLLAKQKYCGAVISKIEGVRSADVVISMPEQYRFGHRHQRPTASVNIVMEGRRKVNEALVKAVAGFLSGAIAEMTKRDVHVTDANNGTGHTVDDPEAEIPSETLVLIKSMENAYKTKIETQLSYIPGVVVGVNALIHRWQSRSTKTWGYEDEPLAEESNREEKSIDQTDQGEPGARPNTGATIESGVGNKTQHSLEESRTTYAEKPVSKESISREVGHEAKQVNVSIGVPRSFLVALYLKNKPVDEPQPDDTKLEPKASEYIDKIAKQVEPLIRADEKGELVVSMFHDGVLPPTVLADPGGLMMLVNPPWAKPVGLSALALLSLALMFGMVRKATQLPPLPSIDELASVPPTLSSEKDLAGLAEESEHVMGAVEVDKEAMRAKKIADQIGEMIQASPGETSALLSKWVRPSN